MRKGQHTLNRSVRNRPQTVLRAQALRVCATPSEQALWRELRAYRLGVRFRRQVPIATFIVDFLAPEVRLVVEVDGPYHGLRAQADARRDRELSRLGYSVLRVQADEVERRIDDVLARVRAALGTR